MVWENYKSSVLNDEELLEVVCSILRQSGRNKPAAFFLGPPGIGKSERLLESIKNCIKSMDPHVEIVVYEDLYDTSGKAEEKVRETLTPSSSAVIVRIMAPYILPQDLSGYPEKIGMLTYLDLPPHWLVALNNAKYGALIIEDITEVDDRYTRMLLYRLAYERILKMYRVNKPLFMTGNPSDLSSNHDNTFDITSASGRFVVIVMPIPTLTSWKEYMDRNYNRWDKDIYDFLNLTSEFGIPGLMKSCALKNRHTYAYILEFVFRMYSLMKYITFFDDTFLMRREYIRRIRRVEPNVDGGNVIHTPRTWTAIAQLSFKMHSPSKYFAIIGKSLNKYLASMLSSFKLIISEYDKKADIIPLALKLTIQIWNKMDDDHLNSLEKSFLERVNVEGPFSSVNQLYEVLYLTFSHQSVLGNEGRRIVDDIARIVDTEFLDDDITKLGAAFGAIVGVMHLIKNNFEWIKTRLGKNSLGTSERILLDTLKEYMTIAGRCIEEKRLVMYQRTSWE